MTVSDLLRLTVSHWLASLVCLACIALGTLWSMQQHIAYNGRVFVVFLAPNATDGNVLAGTSPALVATAGVVAALVNGPAPQPQTVGDVALPSTGTTFGWSVRQPSGGSQWVVHYSEPILDVRSTGPTAAAAREQMVIAFGKVQSELAKLQDDNDVPAAQRISAIPNPDLPVYTVQRGSRVRTIGGVGVLGIIGWAAVLLALEWLPSWRHERSGRRRAHSASAASRAGHRF